MRRVLAVLLLVVLITTLLPMSASAAADWDVTDGHFFTQTGGGTGRGYLVSDAGGVRFWSEFKRLGGVAAVGYPVSQRFTWDGFTVQAFQRVIMQWRPECKCVAFVNVFDRLHELGKDEWLLSVRQTPAPKLWNEEGKPWDTIVRGRLAILDPYPAIRAKYNAVVGDPIQANGLPTSDVVDMGNHYAVRCQRVVFQQWKEDVPWARAGEVTVALGGDIAKEVDVLPDPSALEPVDPDSVSTSPTTSISLTGHGQQPTQQFALQEGLAIFRMRHNGSSNFAIWLLDENGNRVDLLVNTIGSFDGSSVVGIERPGPHLMTVEADGEWTVVVEQFQVTSAPPITQFSGKGATATPFFSRPQGLTTFRYSHNGDENFIIWLWSANGERIDLLVNTIGPFDGGTALGLRQGVYLLAIEADGDWRVEME